MIKIVHLLDDFAVGGVTRALDIFSQPELTAGICSRVQSVQPGWKTASAIDGDIIITHFPPSWNKLPFLISLKLRNPGAAIIHVEHSYNREWMALEVPNPRRFRAMMQATLAVFDHIIFVSRAQAKWAAGFVGLAPEDYSVITPFCSTPGLNTITPPAIASGQPLTIGAYGRMVEAKGFHDLIAAFSKVPQQQKLKLLLGGFGPNEKQLASMAAGVPGIEFYGKVSDHVDFFQRCDLLAVPSHYESYGMVATEARMAGRPILVSPVGGLPEQVGQAGLCIDFQNHDEAALSLANLRKMPLASMALAAREGSAAIRRVQAAKWRDLLYRLHGRQTASAIAA